jgi:hypothetical protein
MQFSWNSCSHGRVIKVSPSTKSSKQMTHSWTLTRWIRLPYPRARDDGSGSDIVWPFSRVHFLVGKDLTSESGASSRRRCTRRRRMSRIYIEANVNNGDKTTRRRVSNKGQSEAAEGMIVMCKGGESDRR